MLYSKQVIKHFRNPKNQGSIKNASGVGEVGNPTCGDIMKIYIKIEKRGDQEVIKDIKFETLGCATAIANSSVLTELAKGKEIKDALKISKDDLLKELGFDIPKQKIHCSFLAKEALEAAVKDYHQKSNKIKFK